MTLPKRIAVTLPSGPRVQDTLDRAHRAKHQGYPDARLACRQRRCVWLVGQGDGAPTACAVNDELVGQIAIIGSADCRMRIKAGMPAGIHTQIIAPLAGAADAETDATFAAFASAEFELPTAA